MALGPGSPPGAGPRGAPSQCHLQDTAELEVVPPGDGDRRPQCDAALPPHRPEPGRAPVRADAPGAGVRRLPHRAAVPGQRRHHGGERQLRAHRRQDLRCRPFPDGERAVLPAGRLQDHVAEVSVPHPHHHPLGTAVASRTHTLSPEHLLGAGPPQTASETCPGSARWPVPPLHGPTPTNTGSGPHHPPPSPEAPVAGQMGACTGSARTGQAGTSTERGEPRGRPQGRQASRGGHLRLASGVCARVTAAGCGPVSPSLCVCHLDVCLCVLVIV